MRKGMHCAARAIAAVLVAGASPAFAQTATQTSSTGQMTETEYRSDEVVNNSYEAFIYAQVGVVTASEATWFSYNSPNSAEGAQQFSDFLATNFAPGATFTVGGATITVNQWHAPSLREEYEELVDSNTDTSYYTEYYTMVTEQVTSGDAPNAEVPIGDRGECYTFGTYGPTNFDTGEGAFADCSIYDTITVAPGTLNTNTHTTTVRVDVQEDFTNYDVRTYYYYDMLAAQTSSTSTGTLAVDTRVDRTVRIDSDATRLRGRFGGQALFDETLSGTMADESVQARVERLTRPRGFAVDGAPTVLVWSRPIARGSTAALIDSTQDTVTDVQTSEVVTQQTVSGAWTDVQLGDRGVCTDTGADGNGHGAFATCDGGIYYTLGEGETLTNTHTTQVTETTTTVTTTESWRTTTGYDFTARAVPIGMVHGAVQETLLQLGGVAAGHREAIAGDRAIPADRRIGLWFAARADERRTSPDGSGIGFRYDGEDLAGGIAYRLGETMTLGVAVSHLERDITLTDLREDGDVEMTGASLALLAGGAGWKGSLEAGWRGGHAATRHGDDDLGGVSLDRYDVSVLGVEGRGGPVVSQGGMELHPWVGLDWTRAHVDAFEESGGIALGAPEQRVSRLSGTFGVDAGWSREMSSGAIVALTATLAGEHILDGRDVSRTVYLVGGADDGLVVASAHQPETIGKAGIGASIGTRQGLTFAIDTARWFGDGLRGWTVGARASLAF